MPTKILLAIAFVILVGCRSHIPPVEVEPVVFSHADEMIRNDTFIILADRRVFAVTAFMNACGYDEQPSGVPMHPVRLRTREAIRLKMQSHPDMFDEWKRYYRKKALPNFCYLDYALSLSDDYPFKRIRPDDELGYRSTVRKLADFPAILNSFWETADLQQIWNQVRPDYLAEMNKYDLDNMGEQLAFVWEYLRLGRRDRFTFVSVPNLLDAHYHAIGARYEDYWYMVESPGAHSHDFNVHEYLHSFINDVVEANYDAYRHKLDAYFAAGKDTPIAESYGHPVVYASECLVRALDHRIHVVMEDNPKETKRREKIVNSKTQAGLLLTEPFYRLLADYEQSELNFEEFVSEMLERLPEYHD